MTSTVLRRFLAAALLTGLTLGLASPASSKPQVTVKAIDHGPGKLKEVQASGLLAAPPAKVWKALTNYNAYATFFPRIASSKLDSRKGNTAVATMRLNLPFPLQGTWYTNRYEENAQAMILKWTMIKGSLKSNVGGWTLKPQGTGTLATYTVRTDPGIPLIPKVLIDTATKQTIPTIFEAVETYANTL